jgi:hypothetical protein
MKTPREKNMKSRRVDPVDFDLVTLLTAAGSDGASLPALTMMARDVTGRATLTEADVREQLTGLLGRGLVTTSNGRWMIR